MGGGQHCTLERRKQIKQLHQNSISHRNTAKTLNCSDTIVGNTEKYKSQKKTQG